MWPSKPNAYNGPVIGDGVGNLQKFYEFGMGLLTANKLTAAAGGKSFGALGEGNLKDVDGVLIPDTVTTYSSRLRRQTTPCDPSYVILTVIPKSAQPGTKAFTANFDSYDWKYNLEAPTFTATLEKYFRNNVAPDY